MNAPTEEVNAGYATVGTDTGHEGSGIEAGWALGNLERIVNYGHLAVHRVAEAAKAIIRSYYGATPEFSYFLGCSNGGRQALMEAQRYPGDFDGIVAGAPSYNFTAIAQSFIKNIKVAFPDPSVRSPILTPAALKVIEAKVLEACDAADGTKDEVIDDPRSCRFRLESVPVLNADNPDLSAFTGRGGRLLLWHGWSDPALNALATISYHDQVLAKAPAARDQLRLFLMPGVLHCAGGTGPDRVDWAKAISAGVETKTAPDRIVAAKMGGDGKPARTRPLCGYPARAVYRGTGSSDEESNFECRGR